MKRFYLLRHEDIHGNSGTGVVAEGIIFDDGTGAFTWLTPMKTVTIFMKVSDLRKLHSHNGRTDLIIEGNKKFDECTEKLKLEKALAWRLKKEQKEKKNGQP